jgi:hypothetical protein
MFEVKDGSRTLQFNGVLLSKSTSWRKGSTRWIEFTLYKTESGSYILSRIGVSLVYHTAACILVKRYGLQEVVSSDLHKGAVSCEDCGATKDATVVFPEKHRYWSQVSDDPIAVLDALYKFDESGARYLTNVAQRLLEDASDKDSGIESVYRVEIIP